MALRRILEILTLRRMRDRQAVTEHAAGAEITDDAAKMASQQLTELQTRYTKLEAENLELKRAKDQSTREAQQSAAANTARLAALQALNADIKTENRALADQIQGQQDEIARQQVVLDELEADRDSARTEAEALRKKIGEQEVRIGLAREELLHSEGQIELIKDLVLRESGL